MHKLVVYNRLLRSKIVVQERRKVLELADDYTLFPNIAKEWINWKKNQVNPNTNKTISPKTVETYINTIQNHIMIDFKDYHIEQINNKAFVEDYINKIRQNTPRLAKDLFLLIRCVLVYCKDKKHLIESVADFDVKFPKKKSKKDTNLKEKHGMNLIMYF